MNINQECLINLITNNGNTIIHIDNFAIGKVIYYIENEILTFERTCVPGEIAVNYLKIFNIEKQLHLLERTECNCDW